MHGLWAVRNATYTATPKEKTRPVTCTQPRTLSVRDIERVMIFLNPRATRASCRLGISRVSPAR